MSILLIFLLGLWSGVLLGIFSLCLFQLNASYDED